MSARAGVLLVLFLAACGPAPGTPGPATRAEPKLDLRSILEEARAHSGVPGIAAAVVRSEGEAAIAIVGVRDVERGEPLALGAAFEVGSLTKSMTATAIATLVEQGGLGWDTELAAVLDSTWMRPEYREVSLALLLRHRAGIRRLQSPDSEMETLLDELKGDPTDQRTALVEWMLARPPEFAPGTEWAYSNGGYVVAALLAERASGLAFVDLMRRQLFDSLAMHGARVGGDGRDDEPRGHVMVDGRLQPVPEEDNSYQLPPSLDPAGGVHSSIADLAAYARAHLRGLRGLDGFLHATTIEELHRPAPGPTRSVEPFGTPIGYAAGWLVFELPGHHRASWHNGSAGSMFAWVTILADDDLAIAVVTNSGTGESACREATTAILDRLGIDR